MKTELNQLGNIFFVIHGNHEKRASDISSYKNIEFYGGNALVEEAYPNLIFALDGEIYNLPTINGIKKCIVIGGAYSVDKYHRILRGIKWWEDEQPSEKIKQSVEKQLEKNNWKIDYVLSHTCPYNYVPTEWFLNCVDQRTVDNSTEKWLQYIHNKITYEKWYCAHFHGEKFVPEINLRFLYHSFCELGK